MKKNILLLNNISFSLKPIKLKISIIYININFNKKFIHFFIFLIKDLIFFIYIKYINF